MAVTIVCATEACGREETYSAAELAEARAYYQDPAYAPTECVLCADGEHPCPVPGCDERVDAARGECPKGWQPDHDRYDHERDPEAYHLATIPEEDGTCRQCGIDLGHLR